MGACARTSAQTRRKGAAHSGSRELFRLAVLAIALGIAVGAAKLFDATLALRREPLSRQGLMRLLVRWPWMTLKVLLGIYWQALRLFIKRTPIFRHPETH